MAAHRYWRWLFSSATSGNYALIGEAEMMAVVGGITDVTGTGTATADSSYTANTTPDKVFANDGVTYYGSTDVRCQCWESANTAYPHWLQYDFGAGNPQEIVFYTLTSSDSFIAEAPTAWAFQYSDDGTSWTTVETRTGVSWTASTRKLFAVGNVEFLFNYLMGSLLTADATDGGAFRITGTVTELGAAGSYRVGLFDRASKRCIRETWSAADGSYSFPYIAYRLNGYFAIAYDHGDNPLNAAIADLLTPELMP